MIDIITKICVTGGALSALLVGLSLMYVCLVMVFSSELIGPPRMLFMGLFGIMAFGIIGVAANVLGGKFF